MLSFHVLMQDSTMLFLTYVKFLMKTRILRVKGYDYIYARDSIYIAHGKTKQIEKSFGPLKSGIDLSLKKIKFNDFLKNQEIKKRLAYWSKQIVDPKFLENIPIEKLETLRSDLYRAKNNMGPMALSLMETGFLVDFIYNSNRLEGSRIPRTRVEKEVREKTKTKGEVGNTMRALYKIDTKFNFNVKNIVELHGILMAHEPEKLGLRKDRVIVGNSEVSPWQEIGERLAELRKWYEKRKRTMYPPELAFEFYYKFERIHPFQDGNGRTGRLIMNRILRENKYHPIIISWKRRQAQENAFAKRMEGQKEHFYNFMKEEFVKTHKIFIEKIDSALNVEKLSKVFMQPSHEYE